MSLRVAVAGCPNSGKSSIFNLLTGSSQRVANYSGVTVGIHHGNLRKAKHSKLRERVDVIDIPGCYSLTGNTYEQNTAYGLLKGDIRSESAPHLIIAVVDICQLTEQLPLVLELRSLDQPMIVALNQSDVAARHGLKLDTVQLSKILGCPCLLTVGTHRAGIRLLQEKLESTLFAIVNKTQSISLTEDRRRLSVAKIVKGVVKSPLRAKSRAQWLDKVLLHPLVGPLAMLSILFLIFQAMFFLAAAPSEYIAQFTHAVSLRLSEILPAGKFNALLTQGVLPGLEVVLTFLPPILILNFFLILLEGSGYIARIAFLCDTLLARMGLGGHTVFPFLTGFACAIPAMNATRSIPDSRIRLAAMATIPLIPCSARLPVYTLGTAAVISDSLLWGTVSIKGLVLFAFYLIGLALGLGIAALIGLYLKGNAGAPMELPAYRMPVLRNVMIGLWLRAEHFLRRAATVIVIASTLLWIMSEIPVGPSGGILGSLIGWIGLQLHPLFAPLGFTVEMTIALIPGLMAREVVVSALATVHSVSGQEGLLSDILADSWSLATGISFMVWYIFAPQCLATFSMMRSETNSWKTVGLTVLFLFVLAWLASFATYQLFS